LRHPATIAIGVSGEPQEGENPDLHLPDLQDVVAQLANEDLLAAVDTILLELERRLLRYAQKGGEIIEMADEGLVLASRAAARLRQAQSSAGHAHAHLQVVGVGGWQPSSTQPSWRDDPRLTGGDD
jgi:hypothetical protein